MSDITDGWALGERIKSGKLDRERQAREDAWATEQRGQDRARWEREDKARTDSMGFMEEDMKTLGTPSGVDPAFLAKHGLTPQRAQPQQTPYEARQGFGLSRSAPAPEDRVSAPEVPMAPAPMLVNPDRQRGMTVARLAKTNGDYNGYLNARKQIDTADTSGRYAQLQSAIMDAPPEKIAAFSQTYSDNKTAPGKLTTGKNGLMTLTLDGGDKIQMDRTQVAQYMTGLYKMQQGDPSGMTDISGVSDKLAGAAEKMWLNMGNVAKLNNDVVHVTSQMANDSKRTGIAGAGLKLRREEIADRKKAEPNPELIAKYNDLMLQSEEAKDPKVRAELDQQMRRVAAQISTGMGKPMQVRGETGGKGLAPMSKIEEAGTGYRDNATGAVKYADGRGGYIAEGGVLPTDRAGALKKAGIPDNLAADIPWGRDGTTVGFGGQAYDVNDPADMRALAQDYARLSGSEIAATEARNPAYPKSLKTGMGGEVYYRDGVDMPTQAQWDKYNSNQK